MICSQGNRKGLFIDKRKLAVFSTSTFNEFVQ